MWQLIWVLLHIALILFVASMAGLLMTVVPMSLLIGMARLTDAGIKTRRKVLDGRQERKEQALQPQASLVRASTEPQAAAETLLRGAQAGKEEKAEELLRMAE